MYVGVLTGHVFCTTNYSVLPDLKVRVNKKYDMTENFEEVARELGWAPDARAKSLAHENLRQAVKVFLDDLGRSSMGTPFSWKSFEKLAEALRQ